MVNVVLLHAPADEARARRIARLWRDGRATLCPMGPHRRRIALGARSVLIGIWSTKAETAAPLGVAMGERMASVLTQSAPRAMLAVWDGRPPLAAATAGAVSVIVASDSEEASVERLAAAAKDLVSGGEVQSDLGARRGGASLAGARNWGVVIGVALGVLLAIGGLAPMAQRLGADASQSSPPRD